MHYIKSTVSAECQVCGRKTKYIIFKISYRKKSKSIHIPVCIDCANELSKSIVFHVFTDVDIIDYKKGRCKMNIESKNEKLKKENLQLQLAVNGLKAFVFCRDDRIKKLENENKILKATIRNMTIDIVRGVK